MAKLTVAALQQMKRDGKKIVASLCYDHQMAKILDQAGADLITVGDSLGHYFLGQPTHYEVTVDQMVLFCRGVAAGVERAVVNCDFPFGPVQQGPAQAREAAIRLVKEGHADMVKVDDAAHNLEAVKAITGAGIAVWAQFGFSPMATMSIGGFSARTDDMVKAMREQIIQDARELERAGVAMLDLTDVTPDVYAEVAKTVSIPLLGGQTGPESDGRIVGFIYRADNIGRQTRMPNVAQFIYDGATKAFEDIREGRLAAGRG